jgi:small subunit ribosomal protein S4
MSRYLGPRLRITRRLGHLSGLTRKKPAFKPLNPVNPFGPRKIIPPGEHGRNKSFKKKPYESCEYDYLIRLKLKQRLRFHYGLTERQLVRYVQQAKKIKGSTGRVLLRLLEMRLDNIVFRLHMAPTIKAARQLISHGHILINKKKVTIPSYQCEPKDIITVAPKIISMELVSRFLGEFDREKSRYDRILKILEFGRKGVTMPTKNLKTSSKTFSKNSQSQKRNKIKNVAGNVKSLKIGAVLNVTINHRGRKEADAISYGFGKMIVIHPFFVGKQSINKKVNVIIYKKSKNNKILYTYPANPFYLHVENLRKLNALDVAKLFSDSNNQIASRFNKKPLKKSITKKSKRSISALIVMNGAKMLPKTNLERRKRITKDSPANLTENKQIKKEFSPSVFVRIVAAKCLNSKSKQISLSTFQSSLKKLNPSFSKDPVAYREKYVYTKTSRALRLFGTRFYATILKNTKDVKNSSFMVNEKFDSRSIIGKTPKVNFTKTTRKTEANGKKENHLKNGTFFKSVPLPSSSLLSSSLVFPLKTSLPVTFKSGKGNNTLTAKQNSNKLADQSFTTQLMNEGKETKLFSFSQPALFNQYKDSFSKLSGLKNQKNFKKPKLASLRSKILTNFLCESKNLSLNLSHFHNFIFVVFSKFCKVLVSKTNLNFKIDNILSISQNFKEFFKHRTFEVKSIDSNKFSMDVLLFSLKLKHFTKLNNKNHGIELDKKIHDDISLLLLLDKMKTHLQTSLTFVNTFFSSEILINGINPYFSSIFSFVLKSEALVKTILTNVLNTVKTVLTCSKLTTLKTSQQSSLELEKNLIEKLVNFNSNQSNILYKKIMNFAMVSLPKAVFLVDDSDNQVGSTTRKKDLFAREDFHSEKLGQLVNKYSLYSAKKQKIQMVKTLNFLKRYNLINYSNVQNFKKMIQLNSFAHQTILLYVKDSILNKSKLTFRHTKLSANSELVFNLEQKLLIKQTKCKINLLESLKSNWAASFSEAKLPQKKETKKATPFFSSVAQKVSLFSDFNRNCNQILYSTKIFMNLLNKKNSLFYKLKLLKDFHLIKKDYEAQLKNVLNNQFQLLQKVKSLVSIVDFPQSVSQSSLLNRVLNKNLETITETFGSISTLWKVLMLQKQNKLNLTESFKQNMLKNISAAKADFTQTVLLTVLNKTDLSVFIKNYQSSKIKNFTFISKLHKINLLDKLNKLNLLDETVFVQMFSDIREKLALKKLKQTNIVLTKLVEYSTFFVGSKLSQTELLSLDSFIQSAFLNSNSLTNNISPTNTGKAFWKKFSFLSTPSLMKRGLENLKTLNIISASQYSYLILKLQNLYNQNKTLNLGLNKQYVNEKLRIIKTLLIVIVNNLNITTLKSNTLNLFNNTTWGVKTILNLGLNRQKEFKVLTSLLKSQQIKYSSKFQCEKNAQFSFLMTNYINNQYNYLISKLLMQGSFAMKKAILSSDFYSRENSEDYFTDKLSFLQSETKQILTSIKLYLLRYQFIVQNNKNSSKNSSRIFSLKKQKSVLLDKTMYQNLKTFLQKEILSNNMKSLLENKHFILAYLNKELKAKLFYKVSRLERKNTLLTETEIYEFSNTFKKLTASNLSVKLATNLSTLIPTSFTKKLFKIYKSTNIPVYYNLLANDTTFLDNKLNQAYLSKVLNKLKLQLNNNKLDLLMVNYTNDKMLRLKAKSSMYQTFTKLAFIENGMILNRHLFPIRSAKSFYLKQFNKNLKFVIYLYNLNMLRSRDILSVQQYEQFKDQGRELNLANVIFKLIKKKTSVISTLNKRKKWKFINYGTYQTLFKNISKNLTSKILSLFQQNNLLGNDYSSEAEVPQKKQTTFVSSSEKLAKNSLQKETLNKQVQSSLEVEALVQQTLEQLVNSFESPNSNLTSVIYRFIAKSSVFTDSSSISLNNLTIENKIAMSTIIHIKKALQRLISFEKKAMSPLNLGSSKEKTIKGGTLNLFSIQNLLRCQKIQILQSLVSDLQKQETPFNSSFKTVYNQFKQISMFQTLSFVQRKTVLNKLCLNTSFSSNLPITSKATNLSNVKKSGALALSAQLANLQLKLQNEYLTKFNVRKNDIFSLESDLMSFKEAILLMLQKTTGVDLTNYKQFTRIFTNNLNMNKSSLAKEIYTTKLLFEFIRQNLMANYRKDKFNFELNQISKFQKKNGKRMVVSTLSGTTQSSPKSQNIKIVKNGFSFDLIKLKISKLLNHTFTVMPFVNNQTTTPSFISYDNIDSLVSFGIISSTMANVLNKKINVQIQKQKLRKTLLSLQNLLRCQKITFTSSNKFNRLIYSSILMDVFSRLYELKKAKTITERKYVLIKQKLKIFSLFSALNYKVLDLKENGSISNSKALELKNQIIQKISQKMKKAKTFAKFKQSLKWEKASKKMFHFFKSLSLRGENKLAKGTFFEKAKAFEFNPSLLKILKSRGRWARVTVNQLVKQKLVTTKQQEKLQTIVDKQNLLKMKKLRRLVSVFVYCRQIVETQGLTVSNNSNYEPLMQDVISSVLKSFTGPWRSVLLNLLYKQKFISQTLFLSYLTNNTQKTKASKSKVISLNNSVDGTYTKIKFKRLLTMYYKQISKLRQFQKNREIPKGEFEQKLSVILSSIILVLEKGGLDAFKVIYNTKWINELCQSNLKINNQKNKKSEAKALAFPQISLAIREFVSKYNFLKDQYLTIYKKSQLNNKMKLFKIYKNNLLQELVNLEKTIQSSNAQSFEKSEILSISRLEQLKMQGLISIKICNKLTVMLNNSLQRLIKLDRLFALQNLYLVTSEAKAISENASYTNTGAVLDANSSKVQIQTESNIVQNNEQYIKLKQKIFQSYFRYEYKQIEKSVIKQKLLLQRLDSHNLKQKTTKQYKTNLRRKKSKLLSSEQFTSFFQQLLNFLDSRYKSVGRNRRNPRINSIIRRLNQKLSFDKTLTKKFGDHLQTFIDKRFGPALPIPPHLELKRWKIKTSKLQSKQKSNLKYFILPVGIVRDLAPRRSVGLPILERLIVEYYSRN